MTYDVFVSYSSKDKIIADAAVSALEQQNFRCWYAPRDIKPSADWGDSITEAISACKIVLLIFSGNSNQSQRVRDEIYYAISEEKVILPFRIEKLDPTGAMRLHLSSRHWLDAYQPSWQAHLERLVGSVADSMGRAPLQAADKAETPAPVFRPEKKAGKKAPWLWVGLAVAVVAAFIVGGVLWQKWTEREAQPTEISAASTGAPIIENTLSSTPENTPSPTPENPIPAQAIYNPRNGHSYLYVDIFINWHQARDYCANLDGYLATVQDAAENIFIYSLNNGDGWLGATDEEEEGVWTWVSGEPWVYNNWAGYNPDNSLEEEHYLRTATASPSQWNDSKDDYLPFVCEWEPPDSASAAGGKTIVVTSMEDSGEGTLRQAMLDAQPGDTITFDTAVFTPAAVGMISLKSVLPTLTQGFVTLDASSASVVLDGRQISGDWTPGIEIVSNYNVVKGFAIMFFSGPGISLHPEARFNLIGGNRQVGLIPLGEGNFISQNSDGIAIWGSDNVFTGNLIGVDNRGTAGLGNRITGIILEENASNNLIGPDNVIAYNGTEGGGGIEIRSVQADANIIMANHIYENQSQGIAYNISESPPFTYSTPPVILYADQEAGVVYGQTCVGCLVEVFSTDTEDGKIYEGSSWADEYGYFHLTLDKPLAGPYLTATSRLPGENTSEFSLVSSARSEIQTALNEIRNSAPFYQTGFDTGDLNFYNDNVLVEDGKLIVTSEGDHASARLTDLYSDQFAVEFEFRILDAEEGGHCVFETGDNPGDEGDYNAFSYAFLPDGYVSPSHHVGSGVHEDFAVDWYDETITNTVTVIVFGDQIAAFKNGVCAWSVFNPDGRIIYLHQALSAAGSIVCEYDNYKVWDLSGVNAP